MVTDYSLGFALVRGAVAIGFMQAAAKAESVKVGSATVSSAVHHAYFGAGLLSSAPWLVHNTPESAVFTLLGVGFIGIALLGRKKIVRR